MKLSTICKRNNEYDSIRILLSGHSDAIVESIVYHAKYGQNNKINRPFPYIFVESVGRTGIIPEGKMLDMFKTGLENLRAAITPGPSGDLNYLLGLMANNSGGIEKIKEQLARAAATQGSLLDDTNNQWWIDTASIFGPTITADMREEVKAQIQSDVLGGAAAQPVPAPPDPNNTILDPDQPVTQPAAAQPVTQPAAAQPVTQPAANQPASITDLLAGEKGYQSGLESKLAQLQANRQTHQSRLDKLLARLAALEQQGPTEDLVRNVGLALLEDKRIANNIHLIGNYALRQLVPNNIPLPTINEAGLLDRLENTLRNTRTNIANPAIGQRQAQVNQANALNTRIAKLAIQAFTDQLKTAFNARLQAKGMTPDNIAEAYRLYSEDPMNQEAMDILNKAFRLFNKGKKSPYSMPKPIFTSAPVKQPEEPILQQADDWEIPADAEDDYVSNVSSIDDSDVSAGDQVFDDDYDFLPDDDDLVLNMSHKDLMNEIATEPNIMTSRDAAWYLEYYSDLNFPQLVHILDQKYPDGVSKRDVIKTMKTKEEQGLGPGGHLSTKNYNLQLKPERKDPDFGKL